MYGILISAFNAVLAWVFQQVIIKFLVLFALYFVIQAFLSTLGGFIPNPTSLTGALGGIAGGTWYFLDLFAFSQGAPMVVTALVYRFLIRRIPLIG